MRAIAIVLAITGALAVSGIAHPHRPKPDDMGAAPPANPTLGTRDHPPTRHIITVTPRITEASPFTLHPRITAIGTADPDTGITAGIIISKVTLTRPELWL